MALPLWLRRSLPGLLAALLSTSALAIQPRITAPGVGWGEIRSPGSTDKEERHNVVLDGAIEQGVNFSNDDGPTSITALGKLNYVADTEELDFNNKLKLGLGLKMRHVLSGGDVVNVGAKYEWDRRFHPKRTLNGPMLFADFFKAWMFKPSADTGGASSFPLAYPGLTWAELRYPGSQDRSEKDDLILEGAVEQGIDWFRKGKLVFNTFAEAEYTADTEKLEWNNKLTLGAGVKLKFPLTERASGQAGVKYNHTRKWESGQSGDDLIWFFGWSNAW